MRFAAIGRVLAEIDAAADEAVAFTGEMIRVPTVNPPGEAYADCAQLIGHWFERSGLAVEYFPAEGRPKHTRTHPRINVVGTHHGRSAHPLVPELPLPFEDVHGALNAFRPGQQSTRFPHVPQRIQLRVEVFNLFNQARFGQPGNQIGTASFGRITTAEDGRIIQLAAKYSF